MRSLFLISILFLAAQLHAQLGLTAGYRFNDAPGWNYPASVNDGFMPLGDSWAVGLDYRITMGQARIDLLPEVNFGQSVETMYLQEIPVSFTQNALSFLLNANIYLLDLEGDCDCPTFSKSGNFFQKGFFLQASPGLSYFDYTIDSQFTNGPPIEDTSLAYSLGVGAGLDIGLSYTLTLTPMAGFRYYFPSEWEGLDTVFNTANPDPLFETESAVRQVWAGLRLGLSFN